MHKQRAINPVNPTKITTPKTANMTPALFTPFEQHFKIYLRVKPNIGNISSFSTINILNQQQIQITPPYFSTETERVYKFSSVFAPQSTNQQLFDKTVIEPINNVLEGYNSTIFIYGMTGAGKTHTMFHDLLSQKPQDQGLVGQAIRQLHQQKALDSVNSYQLILSFYEIYNENIRDLLGNNQSLQIMQDPIKGTVINDLRQITVASQQKARKIIQEGLTRRSMNATANNQVSSRSHAILQFTLRKFSPHQPKNMVMCESKLFMIDLAGNQKASQHQNKRFIEGVNINKSLLTLGKCINILAQQKKNTFLPFRDSKLTRILKDSLGGNSKTVMIACVSSEQRFYEETLNTLKYSTKAGKIKNKGKGGIVRIIEKTELISCLQLQQSGKKYSQELKLKKEIAKLQKLLGGKQKIEQTRQELQTCYFECQRELKHNRNSAFAQKMDQINEILPLLNRKYDQICQQIQKCTQHLVSSIKSGAKDSSSVQIISYTKQIEEQNRQIAQLKRVIEVQNAKIKEFQSQSLSRQKKEVEQSKNSTVETKRQNVFILIKDEPNKNSTKSVAKIGIQTPTYRTKQKQIFMADPKKRSRTPKQSLKQSLILQPQVKTQTDRPKNKYANKPIIDISVQAIKLKSPSYIQTFTPTMRTQDFRAQISLESQQKTNEDEKENVRQQPKENIPPSKQTFLLHLQQIDKNPSIFPREDIISLLEQLNVYGYELSRMQQCAVNKLKFMMKTSSKPNRISIVHKGVRMAPNKA